VHIRKFDAADEEAVKAVVDDAVKKYGRLDIFFANAGIVGAHKQFSEIDADEFLNTLKTNVVRYALPYSMIYPVAKTQAACILRPNIRHQQ